MNDYIQHHGIKGQKWGVRRYQNKDGSLTAAGKKRVQSMNRTSDEQYTGSRHDSEAYKQHRMNKEADELKKADMREAVTNRRLLSDDDLKKRIERVKMEKQLKELTAEEIDPGKTFVIRVLSNSGTRFATTLVTGAVLYGVKSAMTKNFDLSEAAGYMTPKPKK